MSEMIERVARALCKCQSEKQFWQDFEIPARAAIEAMRKPTEAMILAPSHYCDERPDHWRAMIDAALS